MKTRPSEAHCDLLIVGGGTGGTAAAMAACSMGLKVILTEETGWLGGQLTSQAVPPDEHPWIESFGCTRRYRQFRDSVRNYYRHNYPLTQEARANPRLNPGNGWVSRICFEPRVGVAIIDQMLAPARVTGRLQTWLHTASLSTRTEGDEVRAVEVEDRLTGERTWVTFDYVLDATELGDLLAMSGTEYVFGAESQAETGEPHAPAVANPNDVQGFTWCLAMGFDPGGDHVIDKPPRYEFLRDFVPALEPAWPGKLLSWTVPDAMTMEPRTFSMFGEFGLFSYRQIVDRQQFSRPENVRDVTILNWVQNDLLERAIDVSAEEYSRVMESAKHQSLALLYWLQTEAPRDGGGYGFPELFLAPEVCGTKDGFAMAPYHRESRRIRAEFTVTEAHVGVEARGQINGAEEFPDSVGLGAYRIDLHPSADGRNSVDLSSYPFQIPLGALLPVRVENLLPACKNLGVTHITNGCFRLHPVEWNIGESAALLVAFARERGVRPRAIRAQPELLADFQALLRDQGVEVQWPALRAL